MIFRTIIYLEQDDCDLILKALLDKGMSIRQLGREMNYSHTYLSDVLKGRRSIPNERLERIEEILDINLNGGK